MTRVMLLVGAGQIGMAIARRMGPGIKIADGDKNPEDARRVADIMNQDGYVVEPAETDLTARESVRDLIGKSGASEKSRCS